MSVVLVAGGAGTLGREVVRLLAGRGDRVRVLSRRPAPDTLPPRVDWSRGDVVTGEGIDDAFPGVGTVVHAATTQPAATRGGDDGGDDGRDDGRDHVGAADVDGTDRLLDAAARAGIFHFLYVSIVGMEGVPIAYYRAKLLAESMVAEGTVPWSILRITQFHPLIDRLMTMLGGGRRPFLLPAGLRFQPIDPADAGRAVVAAVDGGAGGRLPDVGGPEVRESHDLARSWLDARDERRRIWPLPLPGRTGRGLRAGVLTCPDRRVGVLTWEQWLASRSGRARTGGN